MKINEYRATFELDGAPLSNIRYEEFLTTFVAEFEESYKKVNIKTKGQLKQFVSDFRKKFDAILADTIELDLYSEKYERLWAWFYANYVVPKFVKEPDTKTDAKKAESKNTKKEKEEVKK